MKNTERLLLEIGLRPSRRGFAQSAMLLCILRDRPEIRSSSAAYALAAERLIATPGQLERNLRVAIREAWERGRSGAAAPPAALVRRRLPAGDEGFPVLPGRMAAHWHPGERPAAQRRERRKSVTNSPII